MTRRCTQRSFLLRPDEEVTSIYLYCLGEAALRCGITLLGWVAMSNHQHVLVRDNNGNYPQFLAHLNKLTAQALNAHWRRRENLWASEQPSVVHCVEPQDRFDKLIYLLANPVASHLVDRVCEWPGASSYGLHLSGASLSVKRPKFFRANGPLVESVTLRVERPDGFEHLSEEQWAAKIADGVRAAEERAREDRASRRMSVLGREAVLAAKHTDRPDTVDPPATFRPSVACKNVERRISELAAILRFRAAYRIALERWRAGQRDAVFPRGTYRMTTFAGVRHAPCEQADEGLEAASGPHRLAQQACRLRRTARRERPALHRGCLPRDWREEATGVFSVRASPVTDVA